MVGFAIRYPGQCGVVSIDTRHTNLPALSWGPGRSVQK